MRRAPPVYAVVRWAGLWRVLGPDEFSRTYNWQVDAEEAALKMAARDRAHGADVQVLLQDRFGEMRSIKPPVQARGRTRADNRAPDDRKRLNPAE